MSLGDVICTEGDCQIGRSLVQQMVAAYGQIVSMHPDDAGFEAKYGPAKQALEAQLAATDTWAVRWVPFHPGCCTIKEIGSQAQALTQQMLAEVGAAVPGGVKTEGPTVGAEGTLKWLAIGALVVGGIVAVGYTVRSFRR